MADSVGKNNQGNLVKSRPPPPALNPESCALVQPYKDFVGKGFFSALSVEFSPMGTVVFCRLRADLLKEGENDETRIAVSDAKQRIVDANLWTPGSNSKANKAAITTEALPKKSICKDDFEASDQELSKRVLAVAKALGDTTARGRIGSLKMMIEGVDTFEKWWAGAAAAEKTRLLADKKHHESFTDAQHLKLSSIAKVCPFRGPVPTPSEESEEEEEKPQANGVNPNSQALVPKKKERRNKQ